MNLKNPIIVRLTQSFGFLSLSVCLYVCEKKDRRERVLVCPRGWETHHIMLTLTLTLFNMFDWGRKRYTVSHQYHSIRPVGNVYVYFDLTFNLRVTLSSCIEHVWEDLWAIKKVQGWEIYWFYINKVIWDCYNNANVFLLLQLNIITKVTFTLR